MAIETHVTLVLDSASLYQALQAVIGEWSLTDHHFNPAVDEVRMSYDAGGSGRVGLTVAFELDAEQMTRLLEAARAAR